MNIIYELIDIIVRQDYMDHFKDYNEEERDIIEKYTVLGFATTLAPIIQNSLINEIHAKKSIQTKRGNFRPHNFGPYKQYLFMNKPQIGFFQDYQEIRCYLDNCLHKKVKSKGQLDDVFYGNRKFFKNPNIKTDIPDYLSEGEYLTLEDIEMLINIPILYRFIYTQLLNDTYASEDDKKIARKGIEKMTRIIDL
jgi:hypothetical protein